MPVVATITIDPCDHLDLVHEIAPKFVGRGVDYDDLVAVGYLELVQIIPAYGNREPELFRGYAYRCITGAMRNEIYDQGRSIRVPRKYHNRWLRETDPSELSESAAAARHVLRVEILGDHSLERGGIADFVVDRRSIEDPEELPDADDVIATDGTPEPVVAPEPTPAFTAIPEPSAPHVRIDAPEPAPPPPQQREPQIVSRFSSTNGHSNGHAPAPGSKSSKAKPAKRECPACGTPYGKYARCYNRKCKLCSVFNSKPAPAVASAPQPAAVSPDPVLSPLQRELAAAQVITGALEGLDQLARERVMAWVLSAFRLRE